MKPYWVSWRDAGGFEYRGPWWICGVQYAALDLCESPALADSAERLLFVAAVMAPTLDQARTIIVDAHADPEGITFRFLSEKPPGWEPFCERFPRMPLQQWPWPVPAEEKKDPAE